MKDLKKQLYETQDELQKYKRRRNNLHPCPSDKENYEEDQGKRRKEETTPRRSSAVFGLFRNVADAAGYLINRPPV